VRGFNSPQNQFIVKNYIYENKVDIILLQEVKMFEENFKVVASNI